MLEKILCQLLGPDRKNTAHPVLLGHILEMVTRFPYSIKKCVSSTGHFKPSSISKTSIVKITLLMRIGPSRA